MVESFLEFDFLRRAILVGLIVGFICPMIGVFIVARRLSVIGEALSHMSLSGIAFGSMLGTFIPYASSIEPSIYGLVFAVIGAFLVEWLRRVYSHFAEIAIPILLSFGIGLGVVIFSATGGFTINVTGYLFGNLLAVTREEVVFTACIGGFILLIVGVFYKEFLVVTFDPEFSGILGIRKNLFDIVFIILLALTISITVRAVGVMLVSGLMILPPAAAMIIGHSFKRTLFVSVLLGELAILVGFISSYYFELASGGAIILSSFLILLGVLFLKKISPTWSKSNPVKQP